MPSPFPGMDPYLEAVERWPDVHQSLITYIRDALQPQMRPRYYARMGERVYVLTPPHAFYPDVLVIERSVREPSAPYAPAPAATTDTTVTIDAAPTPLIIHIAPAEHREPYVEIVHAAGDEVVTVIEVLSPANKAVGAGRDLYRRKQGEILSSDVNLVEIDLLSIGQPTLALPPEALAGLPPHRYLINVRRARERDQAEVYPIALSQRLPQVGIPLRPPDPDVTLDLPVIFTQCYDNGGYGDLVDYRQPPPVLLTPEEAAWIDGLLRGRGLRQ
ncbi:MAG: DUF4058 family protein [Anaerolineae bacterium]